MAALGRTVLQRERWRQMFEGCQWLRRRRWTVWFLRIGQDQLGRDVRCEEPGEIDFRDGLIVDRDSVGRCYAAGNGIDLFAMFRSTVRSRAPSGWTGRPHADGRAAMPDCGSDGERDWRSFLFSASRFPRCAPRSTGEAIDLVMTTPCGFDPHVGSGRLPNRDAVFAATRRSIQEKLRLTTKHSLIVVKNAAMPNTDWTSWCCIRC